MLFILLGALVDVDQLVGFAGRVAMLVAFLVLVVRSPSVAIALTGTSLSWRDRALIAWVSPRGIVAAATAAQFNTELSGAGFDADAIGPVTFAVILGTGVVHSLTPPLVARGLKVSKPPPTGVALMGHAEWLFNLARALRELDGRWS